LGARSTLIGSLKRRGNGMQRKQVIFIADSLDNAHKFQQVLSSLDVEVVAGSSLQFKKLLSQNPNCDLVIFEAHDDVLHAISKIEPVLLEDGCSSLLVVVREEQLKEFRLPVQLKSDFVVHGAGHAECAARINQLLWPGNESSGSEFIAIDNMTINLATYQVTVGGAPLDLTYLEYALLSFLVTHPGRTYSRDALLRRVWGFDYYGGSRTVDVHVRRIRAKLGPELAQRLETIRGVGYLWAA
jgi:DNA-binding response OmpR family regulator